MKNKYLSPSSLTILSCALVFACGFKVVSTKLTLPTHKPAGSKVQAGYSLEESRSKLVSLGQSLQAYRALHGTKPVTQRQTLADAGLPTNPYDLIEPGNPWSLEGGMSALRISHPRWDWEQDHNSSHFTYPVYGNKNGLPSLLQEKGEKLVFAYDNNTDPMEMWGKTGTHRYLVLRIDGTVELVESSSERIE